MTWRNEQMYHLRQATPLTPESQENYFQNVVSALFEQEKPNQLLFSYLKNGKCIGYGGLVHINWIDKNAEISFVLNSKEDKQAFHFHWKNYLALLELVSFGELNFHKIYTYAFNLRPHLYEVLEHCGFNKEATLKEHCFFDGKFIDVIIHEKRTNSRTALRKAVEEDVNLLFNWANDTDVRNNALNSEPIIWENHVKWFGNMLNSDKTKIFILEKANVPIGQIRLDKILHSDFWMIDYSIDYKFRGKGFGKLILIKMMELEPKIKLKGIVKDENYPSQKVFEKLGFKKNILQSEKLIEYNHNGK
jgi:RimJ/RimL family protein N-acetyltransferase